MEKLVIKASEKEPGVSFDPESGIMEIKGRSILEHAIDFYDPLVEWLELYAENPRPLTEVIMRLEYFNTSSSKTILDLMKVFAKMHRDGHKINVKWYYDEYDEDMLEAGEDYETVVKMPIELIEVRDD